MSRCKSIKITRASIVESQFVTVHSSRKSYVRLVPIKRKSQSLSQASPTPNPSKRPKVAGDEDLPTTTNDEQAEVDSFNPFKSDPLQPVVPNSNYDYMLQWAPKIDTFLESMYAHAAIDANPLCTKCGKGEAIWRCKSCFASPLFCATCCRTEHTMRPFHRIEMWTGTCFEPSWLWKVGLCLYSGHGGSPCPNLPPTSSPTLSAREYQEHAKSSKANLNDLTFGSSPSQGSHASIRELVVVHTNGVHEILLHTCQCEDRKSDDLQVLEMGLYPSTFTSISTVFTFDALDDYLLATMECNTTAQQYYGKLRRRTNKNFPNSVKDRYRELLRVGRQYDFLRLLMRFLAFTSGEAKGEGDLALFCAACPQPGKNLPENWSNDPESWKYTMSFVGDGNFVCAHLKSKGAGQDVFLKQGQGYFVGPKAYNEYIEKAKEEYKESTCNVFRAIADRNRFNKGYDATGIGAITCARHGAMVPASVVDFQKGERQMNMDYSLCKMVKVVVHTQTRRLVYFYDISCFYCVNLEERIAKSDGRLSLPEVLQIIFGIGQFHVHGHQETCFGRFSPVFIEGIGWVSGEIVESNWSLINPVGRLSNCVQLLTNRLAVESLPKAFERANVELRDAEEALGMLTEAADPVTVLEWEKELATAQDERLKGNVAAMDILRARIAKVPTRKEVQGSLMAGETDARVGLGITNWISNGISIQEDQIVILDLVAKNGKSPTDSQKVELQRRRQDLSRRFTKHAEETSMLFPGMEKTTQFGPTHIRQPCECAEDDLCGHMGLDIDPYAWPSSTTDSSGKQQMNREPSDPGAVERLEVPLPSSALVTRAFDRESRQKEIRLRVAQAEEALQGVRREVGYKSFLFKANRRLLHTKEMRTRGYKVIADADREIRRHVRLYNLARASLMRLSNDRVALSKYQEIKKADLKPLASIYGPNDAGGSKLTLSWLWSIQLGMAHPADSPYMIESKVSRINYLRVRCKRDRWREELQLNKSEMAWTTEYFSWKAKEALKKAEKAKERGQREACMEAADTWNRLNAQAAFVFQPYI
ncbi:hypothetical protein BKA70DRAFT_1123726 [Coprinopsis sp. MPI-PUGE-AT-0042]|nr:hypothetical protein BKA70DRAFT_1123726 [Coprinopsis sp. MPI-PUGE-AT-0042]